jgi:general stress protein 26
MKEKVLQLMASNIHCVNSTIGPESQPQSAIVGFSEDANLGILIGTGKDSRKYKNIASNPKVAIVIADEEQKLEVQYEGIAKVCKADEIEERLNIHFKKLPGTRARLNDPSQAWVIVRPSWVRYVDANEGLKFEESRQFA